MKINKAVLFFAFLFCLLLVPNQAQASVAGVAVLIVGGLIAYGASLTAILTLWGDNIFEFLFNQYSECYTCKYVSRILDFTITGSNRFYEVIAPYLISAIPVFILFYAFYIVLMSFWNRDTSKLNIKSMYNIFGMKIFAMFFAIAILSMPTPKIFFQYLINPAMSLATNVGVKMTALGGGKSAENHYIACMAQKQSWEDDVSGTPDNENYFKDVQKQMTCLTKQVEMVNATGLVIGNALVAYSAHIKYNWILLIPNLGMLLTGFLIMGAFFAASFTFAFYILEVFLQLYLVFIMMPFAIFSYVLTRGGGFPRLKSVHEKLIEMIVSAMFTLVFLCLMLSIIHLINQTVWGEMNVYSEILNAIKTNNMDYIIQTVYFGSKSFIYLLISPIISVFLLSQAPVLASKFSGVVFSDSLFNLVNKNAHLAVENSKRYYKEIKPYAKKGYERVKKIFSKGNP